MYDDEVRHTADGCPTKTWWGGIKEDIKFWHAPQYAQFKPMYNPKSSEKHPLKQCMCLCMFVCTSNLAFHSSLLFSVEIFHKIQQHNKRKHLLDSFLPRLADACFFLHSDVSSSESDSYKCRTNYKIQLLHNLNIMHLFIIKSYMKYI